MITPYLSNAVKYLPIPSSVSGQAPVMNLVVAVSTQELINDLSFTTTIEEHIARLTLHIVKLLVVHHVNIVMKVKAIIGPHGGSQPLHVLPHPRKGAVFAHQYIIE